MRVLAAVVLGAGLAAATPAWGARVDGGLATSLQQWMAERDDAARHYVRSWLRGEPAERRVAAGLTVAAREAAIVASLRLQDPEALPRHARLWGRRLTPETLPVALLEHWDVRFSPIALFAGRSLSLAPPAPLGAPPVPTLRLVVEIVQPAAGATLSAAAEGGLRSRKRGEYIRARLAEGTLRRSDASGLSFGVEWLRGGARLAGRAIRVNGEPRTIRPDFSDGWHVELPVRAGVGQIEIPKEHIGEETQIVVMAPAGLPLVSPVHGRLYTAPREFWQAQTGSAMSELAHVSRHGCGGAGCKGMVFHFVRP